MNTTVEVPQAVNNYYDRTMLERALPLLLHDRFGQTKDIPQNNGTVIKFRKYGALTPNTTPLVEGVTPTGKALSTTDITATVSQYGDYVTITDWVDMTTFDPLLTEVAELLGEQAGQSRDQIIRDIILAGTNVRYADAVANRVSVAAANKFDYQEVLIAVRTMKQNNVRPITMMVDPSTGYATTPVKPCFVGIVHPNTTYDLKQLAQWKSVETYASNPGFVMLPGEVGAIDEIRFCETTYAKVFTAAGASSIDVYGTLILGQNGYGTTSLSGKALQNIRKELGSAGSADPLDQRMTSGYKLTQTAIILQQLYILRCEHSVS